MERGILVVSFGTTYQETREKNIDQMVALVREQYPHYLVEEAYSSSTVRKVLRERDGIAKDDVRQALCRMRDAGVRRVIVFPTHIIDGIENHRMKQEVTDCAPWFEDVRIADALLKTPEDYQRTAETLWESVAAEAGSSPVIFMGHGSEHAADESYERLECVLAQVTENDVYVATVEGSVTIDDVIGRMKVSRHKSGRVLVAPFMLVAGDHANHDMAGEEDFFAAALREAGYEPVCLLKGIGEYEPVRECYFRHLRHCMGTLYGIGVGPGDPELVTVKALRCMEESDLIVLPAAAAAECHAYQIARQAYPGIEKKELVCLPFPMTKEKEKLRRAHEEIFTRIVSYLTEGKIVAFLTIGDPSVYSTYGYIHRRVAAWGGNVKMISGVPSFCAAAASLGISLGDNRDEIHVIPGSYEVEETMALSGTRVYMKSGKSFARLKALLEEQQKEKKLSVYCVENCGMADERIRLGAEALEENGSYLTTLIVKDEGEVV